MKIALISVGLLATTVSQASPAFARSGGLHLLDPTLNSQHINGLPVEIRNAVAHMCRSAQAEHQFARYFEHFRCGDGHAHCTRAGCLHQVYVSTGGRYLLSKSYYAPEGD